MNNSLPWPNFWVWKLTYQRYLSQGCQFPCHQIASDQVSFWSLWKREEGLKVLTVSIKYFEGIQVYIFKIFWRFFAIFNFHIVKDIISWIISLTIKMNLVAKQTLKQCIYFKVLQAYILNVLKIDFNHWVLWPFWLFTVGPELLFLMAYIHY